MTSTIMPFMTWATHVLAMALNKEKQDREVEQNSETTSRFDCRLQLACTKSGIAQ